MKKLLAGLVTGFFMFCVVGIANAALVTQTYDFTFSNFNSCGGGLTPPIDTVIGSVTISFDPTKDYGLNTPEGETNGITLNSLNIVLDSPISFAYNHSYNTLSISGTESGISGVRWGSNDFYASLGNYQNFFYSQANTYDVFQSSTGSVNVSTSPTPIPAAIWIFGSGIAGLAGLRRRKKNTV